jgi:hypothetical protein
MKTFSTLLSAALALSSWGCVLDKPYVSPRFAVLEPGEIAVLPVENHTYLDLTKVTTAGLFQRVINIGVRELNVPPVLREGILDALNRKGYGARLLEPDASNPAFRAPLPPGTRVPYDAVLYSTITSWRRLASSEGEGFEFAGDLEVIRVGEEAAGGGEVLYRSRYFQGVHTNPDAIHTVADLEAELHRTIRSALSGLPARGTAKPPAAESAAPAAPAPPPPADPAR